MLDVAEVLRLLVEETRRRGLPVPVDPRVVWEWADGLGLPGEGRYLLFTGGLYQLVPYINAMVRYLERLEEARGSGLLLRAARRLRLVDAAGKVLKPDKGEVEYSRRVLRSIARMLRESGVDLYYPEGVDWYSGVLLYDMGLEEVFAEHARGVAERIAGADPEVIVVVDPHTAYVLRRVYPDYVDGFDYTVKTYLEILAERGYKPPSRVGGRWVIHDPCLYARGLGLVEEPRKLLRAAGAEVVEARRSGRMTYCCGGPLESISPRLSRKIAMVRMRELSEASKRIVTLCPICRANLGRVRGDAVVEDIAVVLGGGVEGGP